MPILSQRRILLGKLSCTEFGVVEDFIKLNNFTDLGGHGLEVNYLLTYLLRGNFERIYGQVALRIFRLYANPMYCL